MVVSATSGVVVAPPVVSASATRIAVAAVEVAVVASIIAVVALGIAVAVAVIAAATTVVAAVVITPIIPTTATIVAVSAATVVAAAVPWAGADKDMADKVVRTVEAIWSAFVRVVVIVSVRANGSCADVAVTRADSNANGNLSLGVTFSKHENAE